MDVSSYFVSGSIGGVSILTILAIAYGIFKAVNHQECRSTCCGRAATIALDVGQSPYAQQPPLATQTSGEGDSPSRVIHHSGSRTGGTPSVSGNPLDPPMLNKIWFDGSCTGDAPRSSLAVATIGSVSALTPDCARPPEEPMPRVEGLR